MNLYCIPFKHIYRKKIICLLFALCVLALFSCSREQTAKSTVSSGSSKDGIKEKIIAEVGQGRILQDELRHYMDTRSLRSGRNIHEAVDKIVKEMITGEALYQEALKIGLDKDPVIRQRIRQMLGQEMLKRNVTDPVINRQITEEELHQYYQDHLREFSRPMMVRLSDIFIAVPENASDEKKATLEKKAETILQALKSLQNPRFEILKLIKKYADPHVSIKNRDTGFFEETGQPAGLDKVLVKAAFSMNRPGDIYDGVVKTADGLHIIMLTSRRNAVNKEFEKVRRFLERRLKKEELASKRKTYISGLVDAANVKIMDDVVQDFTAELEKNQGNPRSGNRANKTGPPALPGE